MKLKTALLASLVLLTGNAIAADNTGFYMGAGMGYSQLSINEHKLDRLIDDALPGGRSLTNSKVDQNATPYRIFGVDGASWSTSPGSSPT